MKPWKVQKFFGDVVYDLRSRGLLPIAILLVVAMVAVPMLIARGSSGTEASSAQPIAATAEVAPETKTAVVSYDPGVRDYRKRLDDASPKNPFHQKATQSTAKASQLESTAATPTTSGSVGSAPTSTAPSAPPSGGSPTVTHHFTLYHASGDVSFGNVTQPLERHKSLKTYASLPNPVAPVLIYVGSTLDQKKAIFAVPKNVTPIAGEGSCAPDPQTCSLLALGPGHYEDLVYAPDGQTYRVKLNSIHLIRRALHP